LTDRIIVLNEQHVIIPCNDNVIRIFNLTSEVVTQQLIGHHDAVISLCIFDINKCISGSIDRTIKIWNVESGDLLNTILVNSPITNLINFKNSILLSSDDLLKVFNTETYSFEKAYEGHRSYITSIIYYDNRI